jgi:hypothetical protein
MFEARNKNVKDKETWMHRFGRFVSNEVVVHVDFLFIIWNFMSFPFCLNLFKGLQVENECKPMLVNSRKLGTSF